MDNTLEYLVRRVRAIAPDLQIESAKLNDEGLVNQVVVINEDMVFRFARDERACRILDTELRIMKMIRPYLDVQIPAPVTTGKDYVVYPYLPGAPLTLKRLKSLSIASKTNLARQLGVFLNQLHSIPVTEQDHHSIPTRAPVTRERWLDMYERLQAKVYPLLLEHQRESVEDLFAQTLNDPAMFAYRPCLIHGDLAGYHILCDTDLETISAVLDFGVAGVGDPANDIGTLLQVYGESFVQLMQESYPGLGDVLPRARFGVRRIELEWVLLGLETGETFWFTAHIGGARDLR